MVSLSSFGIRIVVASYNEFGSLTSFAVFLKGSRKIGVNSSLSI